MITRACISINNRCNLNCTYCHFHEKKESIQTAPMDVIAVLDNITQYIIQRSISVFKLGFVGNGEPLLDYPALQQYITHIGNYLEEGRIAAYSITNGLLVDADRLEFFKRYHVNLGFSIDGIPEIHNKYRCKTHAKAMQGVELYRKVNGTYPSFNCTVGKETLTHAEETIHFFERFGSRITFSRMIGQYGISLEEFHSFLQNAKTKLNVRTGGYDCTMYGGLCGAGMNNFFFANGKVYLCGNCVDLPALGGSDTPLTNLEQICLNFNRNYCYKEEMKL